MPTCMYLKAVESSLVEVETICLIVHIEKAWMETVKIRWTVQYTGTSPPMSLNIIRKQYRKNKDETVLH